MRSYHECSRVGHLRAVCPDHKQQANLTLTVAEKTIDIDDLWILDNGSNRHPMNDESYLQDVEECRDECVQPNGETLSNTKRVKVTLRVTTCGEEHMVGLTDVNLSKDAVSNIISYGLLDKQGFKFT
ncbi:unnamed protein product [Phytophthora fragariaefolia]|uniref:Unnamed protein product n=1 Tax=Phytophthora fragariaefolia TaxID=1490495 RepID=A0A9W7D3X8_9STRA|nr:unnamed protein product [Phytophthora fragariaefolia]